MKILFCGKIIDFATLLVLTTGFALTITETGNYESTAIIGSGSVHICQEQWSCSWSECIDFSQTYVCTDQNQCGTTTLIPALAGTSRGCDVPVCGNGICETGEDSTSCPADCSSGGGGGGNGDDDIPLDGGEISVDESCEEEWVCQPWSNTDGECGTRTCEDQNECETIELKPFVEEECESIRSSRFTGAVTGVTEKVLTTPGIYIPLLFVFLVGAGGLIVLLFADKKKKKGGFVK